MSGSRYFLDTNAIIALLKGNRCIETELSGAEWIGTSVVCVIEFLSFPHLSKHDQTLFSALLKRIKVLEIKNDIANLFIISDFKKQNRLKLPDAVIAFYSRHSDATLISNDKHFEKITSISTLKFG